MLRKTRQQYYGLVRSSYKKEQLQSECKGRLYTSNTTIFPYSLRLRDNKS